MMPWASPTKAATVPRVSLVDINKAMDHPSRGAIRKAREKIIDGALAGFVPDGLFVGRFEIVNVQHFAGSSGLRKTRQ
jgi:hypothetical protein